MVGAKYIYKLDFENACVTLAFEMLKVLFVCFKVIGK